jgi:hypothetical protein
VRPVKRKVTLRGVGSSFPSGVGVDELDVDDAFTDDVLEDPVSRPVSRPVPSASGSHARFSCPPASSPAPSSSRYAFIASRPHQTLSMLAVPVPADDAPASRRRPTLRTYEPPQDIRDTDIEVDIEVDLDDLRASG